MHVGVDIKCMHTNFGGCGYFGFGDIATSKNGQISSEKFNQLELAQKNYARRG